MDFVDKKFNVGQVVAVNSLVGRYTGQIVSALYENDLYYSHGGAGYYAETARWTYRVRCSCCGHDDRYEERFLETLEEKDGVTEENRSIDN